LWKRPFARDGRHTLLPAYVARVAASAQPAAPSPRGMLADHCPPLNIAPDPLVLVRAPPFQTSRLSLLVQWCRAVGTTPWPERSPQPAQPFPDRLALDDPVATACRGPSVGKAEQVAAPRAPCRWLLARGPLARHSRRLGGMHGQADAGTPLRQAGHHSAGVRFSRAADENILGTTPQKAPARHPGWHIVDKPCGQDPRQEYLCPPGREPPAWRGPLVRGAQGSRLESPGVEPLAEESQSSPLTAPRVDTLSPRPPGQLVDTSTDSCSDDPGKVQRPTLLTQRVPRLVWPGPLSDALGDPMQLRLEDGRQPHHHRSLAKRVLAAGGA
jgi:hypothetical protein